MRQGHYLGLSGWAVNPITGVLQREEHREIRDTQKRTRPCGHTAEIEGMRPQAKERRPPPEALRGEKRTLPQSSWAGAGECGGRHTARRHL